MELEHFRSFGALHGITVAVLLLLIALLVLLARRVAGTAGERAFRWIFGGSIALFNAGWTAYLLSPAKFSVQWSLPMHLCDLSWMVAVWSLFSGGAPDRLRHHLVYYWGLGLGVLGFVSPTLTHGPAVISFWAFWILHLQVVGAALVNVFAFRVRPNARTLTATLLLTTALCALITAFNLAFGTSYWFTGEATPENPTPLEVLGPWPWRIGWMFLLVVGEFTAMTLPFTACAADQPPEGTPARPGSASG